MPVTPFRILLACALVLGPLAVPRAPAAAGASALPEGVVLPEDLFPELDRILRDAVSRSARMVLAGLEVEEAGANASVLASRLRPRIDSTASYQFRREDRRDLPQSSRAETLYYNVGVVQPIYHWGALRAGERIGRIQSDLAEGRAAEAYRLLALEIRSQYLQLIINKMALLNARAGLERVEQRLASVRSRINDGLATRGELAGVELEREEASLHTDRSEQGLADARRAFSRLTGQPELPEAAIPSGVPLGVRTAETAGQLTAQLRPYFGVADNPHATRLRQEIEREALNYEIARVRLRPKLNAIAGATQDEISYTANVADRFGVSYLFAGLQVTWPIFDSGETRGIRRASLARRRMLEQRLAEVEGDFAEQVRRQETAVSFSARALRIAEARLALQEEVLGFRREDVARGVASPADLEAMLRSRNDAEFNATAARIDFLARLAEFVSMLSLDPALDHLLPNRS